MNFEMDYLNPYVKRFIESNIDLIESEDYRTLLKRCLPNQRKNILSVLRDAGIEIPKYDLGKIFGTVIDDRYVNRSGDTIYGDIFIKGEKICSIGLVWCKF